MDERGKRVDATAASRLGVVDDAAGRGQWRRLLPLPLFRLSVTGVSMRRETFCRDHWIVMRRTPRLGLAPGLDEYHVLTTAKKRLDDRKTQREMVLQPAVDSCRLR